ncbi:MAG: endonuclease/exonuclease/phosphatase family protein [Cryobacterium sp.]|nr:endonuclease/exonuclease/phosphatase family protein [Cryobacterium sp.]
MTNVLVMTWNIQGGYSKSGQYVIGEQGLFIKSLAPDIVMLQEVQEALSKGIGGRNGSHGVEQTEALAQATGLSHHRFWMLEDWRGSRAGIGLLSRWPLTDIEQLPVRRPWYTFLPWSYEGPRGILSASVIVDGGAWRVSTTHMSHNGGEYHVNHTRQLAEQAQQAPAGVWPVLGGDFNLGQDDPLFAGLRTTMAVVAGVGGEIDLIWVGKSAAYKASGAATVDCGEISDHNPVLVTLDRTVAPQPQPVPLGRLAVRVTPAPLRLPTRSPSPSPMKGSVQATVSAADATTGAPKAGTVRIDGSAVGGVAKSVPTGQSVAVPYMSEVSVDPSTHERETTVTMARATVSVPGYRDEPVDWGL